LAEALRWLAGYAAGCAVARAAKPAEPGVPDGGVYPVGGEIKRILSASEGAVVLSDLIVALKGSDPKLVAPLVTALAKIGRWELLAAGDVRATVRDLLVDRWPKIGGVGVDDEVAE
jgi:hypothetical protein